jgi:hypothetical protein
LTLRIPTSALAAALALVAVPACDTVVDPFDRDVDRRFAVHGYLDAAADTQFVRVQALRRAADGGDDTLAGVVVRSDGGPATAWQGETGTDSEGEPLHVFTAVFRPVPGERYEFVLERDGVQGARAVTVVPPVPGVVAAPGEGTSPTLTKDITLTDLDALDAGMVVWYEVVNPKTGLPERKEMAYSLPGPSAGADRTFTIFLSQDSAEILRRLGLGPDYRGVELLRTGAHLEILSAEWDSAAPDPGLEDGHGFFASVGRYDVTWLLPVAEVAAMGMVDRQPR